MISNLKNFLQKNIALFVWILFTELFIILCYIVCSIFIFNKDIAWADWFSGAVTASAVLYAVWQNKKQQEGFEKKSSEEKERHTTEMKKQDEIINQQMDQMKNENSYRRSILIFDIIRKAGDEIYDNIEEMDDIIRKAGDEIYDNIEEMDDIIRKAVKEIDHKKGLEMKLTITCRRKMINFLILTLRLLPEDLKIHEDVDEILKAYLGHILYSERMQNILLPRETPKDDTTPYYEHLTFFYNNLGQDLSLKDKHEILKDDYEKDKKKIIDFNKRFLGWESGMMQGWKDATT